jgi:hypothetical protein
MKRQLFFSLGLFIIFISGCLTYETAEIRITFDENSLTEGTIEVIYFNIESSEALLKDQQKDFEELIESYKGDNFLLDLMTDGVYVKERELFEKNSILIGKYRGIFRNYQFDNEPLKITNDEFIILIDLDSDEIVDTNGKIVKSEKNVFISWPKTQKDLYWKLKMIGEAQTYSLLDMYREWKENNK